MGARMWQRQLRCCAHFVAKRDQIEVQRARLVQDFPGHAAKLLLQTLEKEFGRMPRKVLNEARPLDLDLIAFSNEMRATPELTLPHPRAHLRRFVLEPLAEIAPDLVLPGQRRAVAELLRELTSAEVVRKLL